MNAISAFPTDARPRVQRGDGVRAVQTRRSLREARQARRRQWLVRCGLVASAIAIPTLAVNGTLGSMVEGLGIGPARAATPMPFEIAGQSFPGSALYYVEDDARPAADLADWRKEEGKLDVAPYVEKYGAGAAAKAFQMAGNGIDRARAQQCLAMAVYYEAASESMDGQRAVAQVVLNRVAHPAYPNSVCGVVFQGSERRTGCQFTFTCDGALGRPPSRTGWARAQAVALSALAGNVFAPVGTATHYHTHAVNPYWAPSLDFIGSIGAHRFYRWKGNAGQARAFTNTYFGGEPMAAPLGRGLDRAELSAPASPAPAVVGVGGDAGGDPVAQSPSAEAAPAPAAPVLPGVQPASGTVKKEYENSGRWLRQPGG